MDTIWMGIAPGPTGTRVLAMEGPTDTILKARLARSPSHPRAMATLLEAVALWQGRRVRAALCAGHMRHGFDSCLFRETFADAGGTLYSLEWIPARERARRAHRDLSGMGRFADLRDLLVATARRRASSRRLACESCELARTPVQSLTAVPGTA